MPILKALLHHGAKVTPAALSACLRQPLLRDTPEALRMLLDGRADLNASSGDGVGPALVLLLSQLADLKHGKSNGAEETPEHKTNIGKVHAHGIAYAARSATLVQLLVHAQADVNAHGVNGLARAKHHWFRQYAEAYLMLCRPFWVTVQMQRLHWI